MRADIREVLTRESRVKLPPLDVPEVDVNELLGAFRA